MKKVLFFICLLFISVKMFAQAVTSEQVKVNSTEISTVNKNSPLQTKLDAIYDNVKSFKTTDFTIAGKSYNLAKIIRNRCLIILCVLMIIGLGMKILPVMYSPDKELDSTFWIKPVLLALFLAFYPTFMGFADKVMSYLSFRDYNEKQMAVTQEVQVQQMIYNYNNSVTMQNFTAISNTEYSFQEMNDHYAMEARLDYLKQEVEDQKKKMEINEMLDKEANGESISDSKRAEMEAEILRLNKQMENESLGVRIVHAIVVWLCDKISSVVRIFQTVLLCVLFVGGPIAICLEILPFFKGTLKKWFGMYVHTCMFTPIMYIIDVVTLKLYTVQLNGGMGSFLAIVFQISMLVMYISVGKCVGYFVSAEGAGMGDLAKGAMKGAAIATGGAGAVAGLVGGKKK